MKKIGVVSLVIISILIVTSFGGYFYLKEKFAPCCGVFNDTSFFTDPCKMYPNEKFIIPFGVINVSKINWNKTFVGSIRNMGNSTNFIIKTDKEDININPTNFKLNYGECEKFNITLSRSIINEDLSIIIKIEVFDDLNKVYASEAIIIEK